MSKIIVVAGNHEQVRCWIQQHIIPITSKHAIDRLLGIKIEKVCFEGTYGQWIDDECTDKLKALLGH